MDKSRVLTLIGYTYAKDAIGQMIPQEHRKDVYCNISSVSASEWFEAGANGFKPEYRATLFFYDYDGEMTAELDGISYGIYRTYMGRNETVELYLERKAGA